jgi:hypothetical protein
MNSEFEGELEITGRGQTEVLSQYTGTDKYYKNLKEYYLLGCDAV